MPIVELAQSAVQACNTGKMQSAWCEGRTQVLSMDSPSMPNLLQPSTALKTWPLARASFQVMPNFLAKSSCLAAGGLSSAGLLSEACATRATPRVELGKWRRREGYGKDRVAAASVAVMQSGWAIAWWKCHVYSQGAFVGRGAPYSRWRSSGCR